MKFGVPLKREDNWYTPFTYGDKDAHVCVRNDVYGLYELSANLNQWSSAAHAQTRTHWTLLH